MNKHQQEHAGKTGNGQRESSATQEATVRERPILFSGPMVRALLAGTKTQTRRVVTRATSEVGTGLAWSALDWSRCHVDDGFPSWHYLKVGGPDDTLHRVRCRLGQPGDRLWVRETFWHAYRGEHPSACVFLSDAGTVRWLNARDEGEARETWKGCWKPSIHMPRWASRLTLELTGVRVERVQDISEADAIAEGCFDEKEHDGSLPSHIYRQLWDSLNAARGYGWDANPYVWVLDFRRVV